ncbi:unnamed protein product, partial [Mesorhabditis spiculigera]
MNPSYPHPNAQSGQQPAPPGFSQQTYSDSTPPTTASCAYPGCYMVGPHVHPPSASAPNFDYAEQHKYQAPPVYQPYQ